MFNLFRSQERGKKIMLGIILGVVSLGMLLYLIPSGPSFGGSGTNEGVVAEVAGQKITEQMVYRRIRGTFGNSQLPPSTLAVYVPMLIQNMIADRAVAYQAERMGFAVSDPEVGRQILTTPQLANLPEDQREAALRQMGYTPEEFVADYRLNIIENMLNSMIAESVVVTPQELEKAYRDANEKIKISYVEFNPDKFKAGINFTPAEVQGFYDAMKNNYMAPETRNVQIILIDQAKVAATVQTTDDKLHAYYNSHLDEFRVKDRVKAQHILVNTVGKSPDEVKKLRAKADDLLKQVKAGGDFAELAKKNSDDPGSATKGGDLGWMQRDQLVAPFADAAFKLKPGEISDIVTTQFGFHIIKLEEKEGAGVQPFEKVKDQISAQINQPLILDKMQALAGQARAELIKSPLNAEQIANKLGLQFVKADAVQPEAAIPGIGVNKELSTAVNSLAKGQVSELVQTAPTQIAIAEVTAINPAHTRPLPEIEAQVRQDLTTRKTSQIVEQKSKEGADMLTKNGGDLAAVAKSFGLEVKTSDAFQRNGSVGGTMGASYFTPLFSKPVGATAGPINAGGQTVLAKVVEKVPVDMKDFAAQRANVLSNIKDRKVQERRELFQDSVMYQLSKEGRIKLHKDVVDRIIGKYQAS